MKGFDYSKLYDRKIYKFLHPLGRFIVRCKYKVNYVGLENIPDKGGFILASNHLTALDPLYICAGIRNRQLHFMAKKELFDNPIVAWAFTRLNGFPIVRGGSDAQAFGYAVRIPSEGFVLGIFPEGTRSRTFIPQKAKMGVARIAYDAKCGVLPASIYSCDKMKRRTRLTIRFGEMIEYDKLGYGETKPEKEEIRQVADMIMDEITELWRQGHCE